MRYGYQNRRQMIWSRFHEDWRIAMFLPILLCLNFFSLQIKTWVIPCWIYLFSFWFITHQICIHSFLFIRACYFFLKLNILIFRAIWGSNCSWDVLIFLIASLCSNVLFWLFNSVHQLKGWENYYFIHKLIKSKSKIN